MTASKNPIQILIADDDFDTQKILSDFLTHHGFAPITATHGQHALELAKSLAPRVALVDVKMPGPSGLSLANRLLQLRPEMKVIIITAYADAQDAAQAIRQGVVHYLTKPLNNQKLLCTILEALEGQSNPESDQLSEIGRDLKLSPRQLTVLQLLAQGQTNKEIAAQLDISDKTVSNHVSRILAALQVSNRTGAAIRARQLGLICGSAEPS